MPAPSPESIIVSMLSSALGGDLIRLAFRSIFPAGATIDVPINRVELSQEVFSLTMCRNGCGVRMRIRDLNVSVTPTETLPVVANITISISVSSIVNGARAPLPFETTAGDFTLDIDTARGGTDLSFKFNLMFGSPTTRQGWFRVNRDRIPEQLRFEGMNLDVSEIIPIPGYELEQADLSFAGTSILGTATVRIINNYIDQLIPYMRQLIRYVLNSELCNNLGTLCPRRPPPPAPNINLAPSPLVMALGVTTIALFGAILWRAGRRRV